MEEFLGKLAVTQAERMGKMGLSGRCVTLRLWRAVADAPEKMRKVAPSFDCTCAELNEIEILPCLNEGLEVLFFVLKSTFHFQGQRGTWHLRSHLPFRYSNPGHFGCTLY